MKKIVAIFTLGMLSSLVNAVGMSPKMVLDKVVYQVVAKEWVATQSALLSVTINATLTNADLVKARSEIMGNLNQIARGEWQLTQFDRSQDSSGLEKLVVAAQARVPQASLTNIYKNAKDVSKPGASYEINGVEFKPSLEELQQVKSQLRERLYQQANSEIERLNKTYTNQNYSVNRLIFFDGENVLPLAKLAQPRELNRMMMTNMVAPPQALTVSNELIMGALVELASNRKEGSAVANN